MLDVLLISWPGFDEVLLRNFPLVPWPGFPIEFSVLIPLWFLGEGFPSVLLCQVSPRARQVFVVLSPFFPLDFGIW